MLQWLILLTGNFSFFNLLTLVLCLPLLFTSLPPSDFFAWGVGGALVILNVLRTFELFFPSMFMENLFSTFNVWGLLNRYGLFADMTKGRFEIVIEGSSDGETWIPYEFFYKPHSLDQYPIQIAPLQPRVEWQLWFIPAITWRRVGWFMRLLERLLEGSPAVLSLFKQNPFPDKPPRYIRALIYEYKFTDIKTWRETGNYWNRVLMGPYTSVLENLTTKE